MKREMLALALAAGMTTMISAPALAQSQGHDHHGDQSAQTEPAPKAEKPMGMDCPMMQGRMMQGEGMRGSMMGPGMGSMMPMHQMMQGQAHAGAGHAGVGHAGADHAGAGEADIDMSASSIAFRAVNEAMHHGMDIEMTGNADVDFVRGMIAHHVGAVDMARIVQIFGSDPEIAALAEEIIEAQEAEIAMMRDWLDRNAPDHNE
ncbi:MAG: CopM family metallochaperone [Salinarimonas sp.]